MCLLSFMYVMLTYLSFILEKPVGICQNRKYTNSRDDDQGFTSWKMVLGPKMLALKYKYFESISISNILIIIPGAVPQQLF